MAWTASDLPTTLQTLTTAGRPTFIAVNEASNGTWEWRRTPPDSGGTTFSDQTHPLYPTTFAVGNTPWIGTRSTYATSSTFVGALNSVDFDSIYLSLLWPQSDVASDGAFKLTIRIADDAAFSSNVATIAAFDYIPRDSVLCLLNLSDGGSGYQRYKNVDYISFEFRKILDGSVEISDAPNIGHVQLGNRRCLTHPFAGEYDDLPTTSKFADFVTRGGAVTRYTFAEGLYDYAGTYHVGGAHSGNDLATIRQIHKDSYYGQKPVVFIPTTFNQSDFPNQAILGYLPESLTLPQEGPFERDWDFSFMEVVPPLRLRNGDYTLPDLFVSEHSLNFFSGAPNQSYLKLAGTHPLPTQFLTITGWFKFEYNEDAFNYSGYRQVTFADPAGGGGGQRIGLIFGRIDTGGGNVVTKPTLYTNVGGVAQETSSTGWHVNPGDWYFVAVTFDGTQISNVAPAPGTVTVYNECTFYLGQTNLGQSYSNLFNHFGNQINTPSGTVGTLIGHYATNDDAYMKMHSITIWNRCLSAAEILAIYNSGTPHNVSDQVDTTNFWLWTRTGDGHDIAADFPTFNDFSGNNRHMTMTNGNISQVIDDVPPNP